ncbi:hypothetical protein [uncultured Microbacterium sp.]|uniref:hypothetical protein n=1 Tax=uncultured Microbacterium sp. TaxID=191216 RepID=UPI0025E79CB5|nr:hypothetical protein [uncultured Microbacterium sp.]
MARGKSSGRPETHSAAVERMLTATGLVDAVDEAPLVMFVKTLAAQMDADPSSTRTQGAYLSALKDVRRVLNAAAKPTAGKPTGSPSKPEPDLPDESDEESAAAPKAPDNLLLFEQKHGIQ